MYRVGARGHITFGGRLTPDAKGLGARLLAVNRSGDWRDQSHVNRWVQVIVSDLQRIATPNRPV